MPHLAVSLAGAIPALLVPLAAVVGAWSHAKYGRKVSLKVGEIEAEAPTMEEIDKLLDRAEKIQQRNQPKAIDEP